MKIGISIFVFLFFFLACKTTVKLALNTNDKVSHSATVVLKDKNKVPKEKLNGGLIAPNTGNTVQFKLGKKEFFQVNSSLTSGNTIIYSSPDIPPAKKANPFNYDLELKTNINILDDSKASETLKGSLVKTGLDLETTPTNFGYAAENIIGSLIVVVKDSSGRYKVLHTIRSKKLGVQVMKLTDVKWGNTSEQGNLNITGSEANSIVSAIPFMQKFDAPFENNKVYALRWSLNGYGEYLKPDAVSATTFIKILPFEEANMVKNLLSKYKGAKVFYINRVYLLKNADLFTKEGKTAEESVNESTAIISDNHVYSFENVEEKHYSTDCQVLYYWGNEYSFTFDKGKVYGAKRRVIEFKVKYTIYNLNKSEKFSPDIFN